VAATRLLYGGRIRYRDTLLCPSTAAPLWLSRPMPPALNARTCTMHGRRLVSGLREAVLCLDRAARVRAGRRPASLLHARQGDNCADSRRVVTDVFICGRWERAATACRRSWSRCCPRAVLDIGPSVVLNASPPRAAFGAARPADAAAEEPPPLRERGARRCHDFELEDLINGHNGSAPSDSKLQTNCKIRSPTHCNSPCARKWASNLASPIMIRAQICRQVLRSRRRPRFPSG